MRHILKPRKVYSLASHLCLVRKSNGLMHGSDGMLMAPHSRLVQHANGRMLTARKVYDWPGTNVSVGKVVALYSRHERYTNGFIVTPSREYGWPHTNGLEGILMGHILKPRKVYSWLHTYAS